MSRYNAEDDYTIGVAFGQWLRERRVKKGFSVNYSAFNANLSTARLEAIESGNAIHAITEAEAKSLAKIYGLDYRAIIKRSKTG